ncbi:MAG TPA: hypothetical protein VMZ51_08230 [Acidimicrobiales bacterium]|nr:hypothetical protein [Acidimicrobiales bacterium]
MSKLFPVLVRRTTIIQGGDGPNPSDAFSIDIRHAESNAAPTDAMSVAFAFPESNAAPTDALKLGLTFADTSPALSDNLLRLAITHAESNAALTEALALRIGFSESLAAAADDFRLNITHAESNAALTDSFGLRINHADSNSAQTDAATFVLNATQADSNPAQTDAIPTLRINGLGDTNTAPTDGRSAVATWFQGATTAASTGASAWPNPTNAQGFKNGTLATFVDDALNTAVATLTLDPYPDPVADFSTWTITKVELVWSAKTVLSVLTNAVINFEWSINGSTWNSVLATSANFDYLTTPRTDDITAARSWTWTDINNIRTRVRYVSTVITETGTTDVDSVEVRVTATKNPL